MSSYAVLMTSVWGGLMALERRAFLQAMVSRPLVAATVTGLILNDGVTGLYVGLVFELLHLGGASLGGAHPDHDTLPAVCSAALASSMGRASGSDASPALWALSILVCAPLGRCGLWLENVLDGRARKYYGRALKATLSGNLRSAARQNLRAMWPQFLFYGAMCGAAVLLGPAFALIEEGFPLNLTRGLAWAYWAMGIASCAVATASSHAPYYRRRALLGAAITTLAMVAWRWA